MANEPVITVIGNMGSDPELRFMPNGKAVVNFSLASTPRVKDGNEYKDGETTWLRCSAFEKLAENVAESLRKGQRVIVQGRMSTRSYEVSGEKKSSLELAIDAIGPELRFAPVGASQSTQGGVQRSAAAPADQWATTPAQDEKGPAF